MTPVELLQQGISLLGTVVTFVTGQPLLLTGLVIGLAGYGVAVVKNAIR